MPKGKIGDIYSGLTVERLREVISYNPETGDMVWRIDIGYKRLTGRKVGSVDHHGYRGTMIDYHKFRVHRLAWLYVYGEWPNTEIDHINGNKSDNRICNLRLATRSQNNINRERSAEQGRVGVSQYGKYGKWRAYISVNGKQINRGYYWKFEDAVHARQTAEFEFFPDHAWGRE